MTEKSGLTWYQDLIYSIFFFGSGFIAFYLTKDNQTPEVASGVYIAGIVFGIVLTLIFVYIIRHKCLPVQEKTKKKRYSQMAVFCRHNHCRNYSGSCLCKRNCHSCNLADRYCLHTWGSNWSINHSVSHSF